MAFSSITFGHTITNAPGEPEFEFRLLPSATLDYQITAPIVLPASLDGARLSQLRIWIKGQGPTPDEVRLVNRSPLVGAGFPNPDYVIALNLSLANSGGAPITADRLVVENLLLDGGWDWKMDQIATLNSAQGYKNAPLNLTARTGAARKLIVRNFGSVGYVPWAHYGGAAGIEAFPFVVGGHDVGQPRPTGFRAPWEVFDCEIHGFTSAYSGYTTEMMVHAKTAAFTPAWAKNDPARRFAVIRNVQYRSDSDGVSVIAMGNASSPWGSDESGRTTFRDSIVLNASLGYNGDTGKLKYVDILDSLGLNVRWWANMNAGPTGWNDGFNLSNNSLRLGPRVNAYSYRSFCWKSLSDFGAPYTDPSLILGRTEINDQFLLARMGSVNNLTIANNHITTIPSARFDETSAPLANPKFRLLRKVPSMTAASCDEGPKQYFDGANMTVGQNYVSDFGQDFTWIGSKVPLPTPGTYSSVTPTAPAPVQAEYPVLTDMDLGQPQFNFGRICRVLPQTNVVTRDYPWRIGEGQPPTLSFEDMRLTGALEVSMASPTLSSTTVTLPVRIALQQTPPKATELPEGKRLSLKVTGLSTWNGNADSDVFGSTEFQIPSPTGVHGELNVTAFHDPAAGPGAAGQFAEYKVAYAKGTIAIGTVVSVEPLIAVAEDRREGGVQEGRLRFHRTGSVGASLPVTFSLAESAARRPATLGTDFSLIVSGLGSVTASGTSGTITFPAGQAFVDVRVVPQADETIEREHVWVTLQAASTHAVSSLRGKASIFIYDGPPWTLYELTHSLICDDPLETSRIRPPSRKGSQPPRDLTLPSLMTLPSTPSGETRGVGISGLLSAQGLPIPVVAANAWIDCSSPGSSLLGEVGAKWSFSSAAFSGQPVFVFDTPSVPFSPIVTGVSDQQASVFPGYVRATSGFDRAIKAWQGTLPGTPASWVYLPVPTTSDWLQDKNRALCISPNGTYIGGYATRSQGTPAIQEQFAVYWTVSGGMSPLFSETTLNSGRAGEVPAVNDDGEFVGNRKLPNTSGQYIPRAFRSRKNAEPVVSGDFLHPPIQNPAVPEENVPSAALAIGQRSGVYSGLAGGWAMRWEPSVAAHVQKPAVWWSRQDNGPEHGTNQWVIVSLPEESGAINAIVNNTALFGWVGDINGQNRKAWRWEKAWTGGAGFSDKHAVYGFSDDWVLREIVDATATETLVGNGSKAGANRAFLLIPQLKAP